MPFPLESSTSSSSFGRISKCSAFCTAEFCHLALPLSSCPPLVVTNRSYVSSRSRYSMQMKRSSLFRHPSATWSLKAIHTEYRIASHCHTNRQMNICVDLLLQFKFQLNAIYLFVSCDVAGNCCYRHRRRRASLHQIECIGLANGFEYEFTQSAKLTAARQRTGGEPVQ